jgi:TPP-dependent pyruvate/acetoin dehydrogenase alpha subunit
MDNAVKKTLLKRMMVVRAFEETIGKLFYKGQIPGFLHLSSGQEATSVGVCAALKTTDYIGTTHRGHGHIIAKGVDLNRMMAEIFGRIDGFCKGKGGSMHVFDKSKGVLGANGIVGGGIPILTGGALSAKFDGKGGVAVAFFGDGATNEGAFHESLNLAAVWKLPVVFVCENNGFGEFTPMATVTSVKDIAIRAAAYGMPGQIVDGNDVIEVFQHTSAAVARARAGEGPTLLECKTYRWEGHVVGEQAFLGDGAYREKSEIEEWKRKCPLVRFEKWCAESGKISSAELSKIVADTEKELEEAIAFARSSELPAASEVTDDVYA